MAGGAWSAPAVGRGAKPSGTAGQGDSGAGAMAVALGAEATEGEDGGVGARGPVTEGEETGDGGWLLPEEDMAEKGVFLALLAEGRRRVDANLRETGGPCLLLSVRRWKAKGHRTGSQGVTQVIMAVAMEDRVAVQVDGTCVARFHTYLVLK